MRAPASFSLQVRARCSFSDLREDVRCLPTQLVCLLTETRGTWSLWGLLTGHPGAAARGAVAELLGAVDECVAGTVPALAALGGTPTPPPLAWGGDGCFTADVSDALTTGPTT
jgi:hypothetical protein